MSRLGVYDNWGRLVGAVIDRERLQRLAFCDSFSSTSSSRLSFDYAAAAASNEAAESESPVDWATRERIALGSAKGLAYLHDQCDQNIIHRDFKAANVLFNQDFEQVVGDFGLAKFMDHEDALAFYYSGFAKIMNPAMGTHGHHIAPEYLSTGEVPDKTDVFAYGIMLLELITGKKTYHYSPHSATHDDVVLLDWVKGLVKEDRLKEFVDADLPCNSYINAKVEQFTHVALLCSQSSPEKRPKMSDVVQMLQGDHQGLARRWHEYCREQEILPYPPYYPMDWSTVDSISILGDFLYELSPR